MTADRVAAAVAILAWLAFLLIGLRRRRLPGATVARHAAIWAAAFALLFVGALWLEGRL